MKTLVLNTDIAKLFELYLEDSNLQELIRQLLVIELSQGGSIYFRFFEGDTLATTITDIEIDLSLPSSHSNNKYMKDCMSMAVENPDGLQILRS